MMGTVFLLVAALLLLPLSVRLVGEFMLWLERRVAPKPDPATCPHDVSCAICGTRWTR